MSQVYIPDVLAVASFYKDWAGHGKGVGNYLVLRRVFRVDDTPDSKLFVPRGRHPGPRPGQDRAVRSGEDHRVRDALLVRVRRRRRQGPAPAPGGDDAQVHRPQASLRAPHPRRKVQLAEVAALRRPAHGSRSAGPDARQLRLRPRAGQGRSSTPSWPSSASDRRPSSRRSAGSRRGPSRRRSTSRRSGTGVDELAAEHGAAGAADPRQLQVGAQHAGRPTAPASASTRPPAARSATGSTSRTARSPTTRSSCRAPGTPARGTPPGTAAPTSPPCWARRWPTRSSRSRSCAPCTPSTPAWPAASTSSTRSGARSRG